MLFNIRLSQDSSDGCLSKKVIVLLVFLFLLFIYLFIFNVVPSS